MSRLDEKDFENASVIGSDRVISIYKELLPYTERVCPCCGESYKRYQGEIDYTLINKGKRIKFCSWNCKCKYKREKGIK